MALTEKQKKAAFVTAFVRAKQGKSVSPSKPPQNPPPKIVPIPACCGQPGELCQALKEGFRQHYA